MGISPILGLAGLSYALFFVFNHRGGEFSGFYDEPSMVLLLIAPPCIMMLSHTLGDLWTGMQVLVNAMFTTKKGVQNEVINTLTMASQLVRTEGIGALTKVKARVKYPLLRDGMSLILNDFSADEIKHNLEARIDAKQARMHLGSSLFENMSKVCPAVGMMGTLIGLGRMLAELKDPSAIGGGMAMAIIGTLYGLMLGTVMYGPFGEKISIEAEKINDIDHLVLEGVLALKGKKSSVHLRDIVSTYAKGDKAAGGGGPQQRGA